MLFTVKDVATVSNAPKGEKLLRETFDWRERTLGGGDDHEWLISKHIVCHSFIASKVRGTNIYDHSSQSLYMCVYARVGACKL